MRIISIVNRGGAALTQMQYQHLLALIREAYRDNRTLMLHLPEGHAIETTDIEPVACCAHCGQKKQAGLRCDWCGGTQEQATEFSSPTRCRVVFHDEPERETP